jgi:hypothetical protein
MPGACELIRELGVAAVNGVRLTQADRAYEVRFSAAGKPGGRIRVMANQKVLVDRPLARSVESAYRPRAEDAAALAVPKDAAGRRPLKPLAGITARMEGDSVVRVVSIGLFETTITKSKGFVGSFWDLKHDAAKKFDGTYWNEGYEDKDIRTGLNLLSRWPGAASATVTFGAKTLGIELCRCLIDATRFGRSRGNCD